MKVVIIGAGSAFGSRISVDILSRKPLEDSTIALCDINQERLDTVHKYVKKVIESNNLPANVIAGTDRTELLKDADFVVISVSIGGPAYYDKPYEYELEIPRKYGIVQTVADTVGPGGVFRTLRTAPEIIGMVKDVNRLAPKATIINYTNPMAMLTWVINETAEVQSVGLCHSVQGTSKQLAGFIDAPYEEVGYWVAGINHMSWFMEFTRNGKDAYPALRKAMENPETFEKEAVRFEIMKNFGYFVTESSRHMGEYVSYYQHEQDVLTPHLEKTKGIKDRRTAYFEDMGVQALNPDSIELVRSHEYASEIMEAMATKVPMRFNGNVMNNGLIKNLPQNCCVEVPCMTDGEGIHPCAVGNLPVQCAALCRTNVNVQELTVKAVLEKDREAAFHAVCLDPSTAAVLSLKRIREMFEEMWEAEGSLLRYYNK
jgi:alpha-galactosidase